MKKENCLGCYNDDYNRGLGGAKECFSFKTAKLVTKIAIHINQMPPFDKKSGKKTPSCYRRPQMCYVEPKNLNEKGFWKS